MRLILILIILTSCAKGMREWADAEESTSPVEGPYNILNNWNGTYEDPALRNLQINRIEQSYHYLSCNGSYDASTSTNGLSQGQMRITASSSDRGTISFGPLPYISAFNPNCETFSGETLDYTISNEVLTVCLRPGSGVQCFSYSLVK